MSTTKTHTPASPGSIPRCLSSVTVHRPQLATGQSQATGEQQTGWGSIGRVVAWHPQNPGFHPQCHVSWGWWYTPLIPAQETGNVIFSYMASLDYKTPHL